MKSAFPGRSWAAGVAVAGPGPVQIGPGRSWAASALGLFRRSWGRVRCPGAGFRSIEHLFDGEGFPHVFHRGPDQPRPLGAGPDRAARADRANLPGRGRTLLPFEIFRGYLLPTHFFRGIAQTRWIVFFAVHLYIN